MNLDLLPDGVLVIASDGTLAEANRVARELLGAGDDAIGRPFAETFDVRDPLGEPALRESYPEPGSETELSFHRPDGTPVPAVVTIARHDDGTVVLCARPVSDKSGIAIVSTVSHELRSPLTSVKGYTSLMLNRWDRIADE